MVKPLPDAVMVTDVVPAVTLLGEIEDKTGAPDCALNPAAGKSMAQTT
jgi:hypothetical protein